jgi:hypothetical protein
LAYKDFKSQLTGEVYRKKPKKTLKFDLISNQFKFCNQGLHIFFIFANCLVRIEEWGELESKTFIFWHYPILLNMYIIPAPMK